MTFVEGGRPISKFALADLALRSAMEFERFRSGGQFDNGVLLTLADALSATSSPSAQAGPSQFFALGYYKPYMRLFRAEQGVDASVQRVKARLSERARQIREFLGEPSEARADELASFIAELHHELASEHMTEIRLARRRRPAAANREPASSFC